MKKLLGDSTVPSLKLPYDAVFQRSLVIPICNTKKVQKLSIYLYNFCLQITFKSNASFDFHINPIRESKQVLSLHQRGKVIC